MWLNVVSTFRQTLLKRMLALLTLLVASEKTKGLRKQPFDPCSFRTGGLILLVLTLCQFNHAVYGYGKEQQQKASNTNDFQLQHLKKSPS